MGTSRMSTYQILESLCHNNGWNYAVFWKLKNQNSKFLIWGDAYFDFPKPVDVKEGTRNLCFNSRNGFNSLGCDFREYPGSDVGHQLELAVANMSHLVYSLEEGIISQIMISRKHHWVFSESDLNGGKFSKIPDEWKIQFASGIKTIVLAPVMPYGLVQLGSLTDLREDMKLMDYIRSLFISIHMPAGSGFSFTPVGRFTESLFPSGFLETGNSACAFYNLLQETPSKPPTKLTVDANLQMSHNDIHGYTFDLNGSPCGYGRVAEPMGHRVRRISDDSSCIQNLDVENYAETSASILPCENILHTKREAERDSPCSILDQKFPSEQCSISRSIDFDFKREDASFISRLECDTFLGDTCDYLDEIAGSPLFQTISDDSFTFPYSYESQRALEEEPCRGDAYLWDDIVETGANPISDLFDQKDNDDALLGEIEQWFTDGDHSELLLDANTADACLSSQNNSFPSRCSASDPSGNSCLEFDVKCEDQDNFIDPLVDYAPCDSRNENVPFHLASSGCMMEFSTCEETQCQDMQGSAPVHGLYNRSCSDQNPNHWFEQSTMPSLNGTSPIGFSTLVAGSKSMNRTASLSRNELPRTSKKRARPGESCRPRPRDRQLIQDRIKELREMVPNVAKCSIDALFERTIKHMLFLRSIPNHVDKLKNCTQPEVKDEGFSSHHATWEVDLGSQQGSCPLVVENLSHPRHILIEMPLEDHVLFLDIAEMIRGLGLTILKGIMETRADKKWAHFVIEVTRGFERMDILWPLMKLMRPTNILE